MTTRQLVTQPITNPDTFATVAIFTPLEGNNERLQPAHCERRGRRFLILASAMLAFTTLAFATFSSDAIANPSTKSPDKGLQAHNTINGAEKQINAMYAKFAEWEQLVISSTEAADSGKRFPHSQLARIYPETYRGIWYAEHLQSMGEPAGYDLEKKFTMLRQAMGVFASKLGEFQPKEIAKLRKETPARQKALAKIAQLTQDGKFAEADRQMQQLRLKQLSSVFYLTNAQAKPFENEVGPPHNAIRQSLRQQRSAEYRDRAKERINSFEGSIETLQSEAMRFRKELAESGSVAFGDGEKGDAADAIAEVRRLWGNASAALTRSVSLAWAFEGGSVETIAEPFKRQNDRLSKIGNDALLGILNSVEQSTPQDKLADLLPQVLTELALIDRRLGVGLGQPIEAATERLASKNKPLNDQVERYAKATTEPLRWMRRYTLQQVKSLETKFPLASTVLDRKFNASETTQPTIYGRYSNREQVLTPGTMSRCATWLAGDAQAMIGTKLRESAIVRLAPSSTVAIVPQDTRHYSSVPANVDISKSIAHLESVLLLDPQHGPLSFASASAQSSAALQEFANVGGEITGLTVEPFVTRFATMPDAANALVPLDELPVIDLQGSPLEKLIWRVEIRPEWVAHRLFLARLR